MSLDLRQRVGRVLASLLRALPDGLVKAVVPKRYGFDTAAVTTLTPPETSTRLFIGPVNSAGQGWQWARAVERNLDGVGAVAMTLRFARDLGYPADNSVPVNVYAWSRRWGRMQERTVSGSFTHVLIEAEWTLFGDRRHSTVNAEVDRLRSAGVAVAMVCHGSDIRLPSRHAALNEWSPFRPGVYPHTTELERAAEGNGALLRRIDAPVFVSTPDLLIDVPTAEWLPVVIEPQVWRTSSTPFSRTGPPLVVHAPSSSTLKGSDLVDPILVALDQEGVIRYERISGVSSGAMRDIYRRADVVLDQFRLGSYGVAACEAMAAGRVVISHVTEQVRAFVVERTGLSLPIIEATPDRLGATIRAVVANPDEYVATAALGQQFAEDVHDGRRSAAAVRRFLRASR